MTADAVIVMRLERVADNRESARLQLFDIPKITTAAVLFEPKNK